MPNHEDTCMSTVQREILGQGHNSYSLAEASTLSVPTCWRIITGKTRKPYKRTRVLLSAALQKPVSELFPNLP
jgi:hypothetical protein